MIKLASKMNIILIGGTSHTGKSTLAQALASTLGWNYVSTDKLARHPGRPWRMLPETVPAHVAEHYLTFSVEELITDVLRHYKNNVWPIVSQLVVSVAIDPSQEGLVLEGSALWPEWVATITYDHLSAVWLTASAQVIAGRIYEESHYREKAPREKEMIDKFLQRTLVYNTRMMAVIHRLGLHSIDVSTIVSLEQLIDECLELLA